MTIQTLAQAVGRPYPGRGIVLGMLKDGAALIGYFIMGRSENSRNRVFLREGEGIRTRAFDPARLSDPSLVIYTPMRRLGDAFIVTNGDQTDTVYDHMAAGKTFEDALRTREYEPDAPHFTPRVSGLLVRESGAFSYRLSILKAGPGGCLRQFFEYPAAPGLGHFIHTYADADGPVLPSFEGEPKAVELPGTLGEARDAIWMNLDADNRVSLLVQSVDAAGEVAWHIVNQNGEAR
ncbi:MAG: inosine monophosphate cyclohydrolase [Clostridiales bacterium]|nr:inosine monophosphate cyclohydrolase [Clostridiales bacterium]